MFLQFVVASLLVGLDKGGLPGAGALGMSVALLRFPGGFSSPFSATQTLALFPPVLMAADFSSVIAYRKDVEYGVIRSMILPVILGMLMGFWLMFRIDDLLVRRCTGAALILLTLFKFVSQSFSRRKPVSLLPLSSAPLDFKFSGWNGSLVTIIVGLLTGFFTVIANVAGPIVAVYLMELRFPKRRLNGTRTILFLVVNFLKIPIQIYYNYLQIKNLGLVAILAVIAAASTFGTERWLISRVPQSTFEIVSWVLVGLGGLRLLF